MHARRFSLTTVWVSMFNRESAAIVGGCGSALVCLFVLAQFFVKVLFVNDLMGNAFVAAIGVICLLYVCEKEGSSPLFGVIFGFASCVSLLMLVSMLYNQNTSLEDFLWVWAYSGPVAIMLFQSVDHRAFTIAFYAVVAFLLVQIAIGVDSTEVFKSGSRNGISSNVIILAVLAYYYRWRQLRKINLLPALLAVPACLYSVGRAGVAISILLLAFVFVAYLVLEDRPAFLKFLIVALACALIAIFAVELFSGLIDSLLERFQREGLESGRAKMWSEYFGLVSTSFGNLLLGAPTMADMSLRIAFQQGNLHNSFLMLHAHFGAIGFVVITVCSVIFLRQLVKRGELFVVGIIGVAIARMLFDGIAFFGPYDLLFMCMVIPVLCGGRYRGALSRDWNIWDKSNRLRVLGRSRA